ncbi:MAG: response regulator transcription factor [Bdellovibrionaceae bacterium]|nr:response regulator transcription factor [Pseudobdellovibrionaceae bacterium]
MAGNSPDLTQAQVLVVEDEVEIRDLISLLLLRQGHRVQSCGSALEAQEYLQRSTYDLIVLDWMLPQMSGVEFLRLLKSSNSKTPVLMVTAKTEPQDIVQGLESGADDYVTKPFEPSVFAARVRALLRRAQQAPAGAGATGNSEMLQIGEIAMNLGTYECRISGEVVHLTPSEFKILSEMIKSQGRVLTREALIETVQGEGISVTGRTIDTHVFGLRKKMGPQADWIETIRGVGYRVRSE